MRLLGPPGDGRGGPWDDGLVQPPSSTGRRHGPADGPAARERAHDHRAARDRGPAPDRGLATDDGPAGDQATGRLRPAVASAIATALAVLAAALSAGPAAAHGPVPPDPPTALNLVFGWSYEPALILPVLAVAIGWWRMLSSIDRAHPQHPVPAVRRWSFLAGLGVVLIALQSGIERYDTTLFSIHMVQHILLALVAPPLLALGAPITQLLRASSPATRNRWILPFLRSRPIWFLSHPVVAWVLFASVMWGTHFSPLFDLSLENRLVHDLEHVLYIGAALLFWWPIVGLDPAPHRMGHAGRILDLFMQMPQTSFLSMAILFAGQPLYPHYATLNSPYGIDALADQQLAAGIMWFVGDVIFMVALLVVLAGWIRSEERGTAAAEHRADVEREAIREREAILRRRRAAGEAGPVGPVGQVGSAGPAGPAGQAGSGEASSSR
jgi:putative membrane protein